MASLDFVTTRNYLKQGHIGQVTSDVPVAIRMRAKTAAGAVTSVTVTTATNIVSVTASGGTETWAFATYTTIGKLADAINASAYWECKILDALRSDASTSTLVDGAITASVVDGVTYYDVKVDTSTAFSFSYRLTYDRSVGEDKPVASHRVHLQEIQYNVNVGTAAMDNFQIFKIDGTVETQIWKGLNVDATATTVNWASGEGKITAAEGCDLLVRIKDAAALADAAGNYLTVIGELE